MKFFFHRYILLLVVFLTGASILILEVVAVRLLSIYFGNTIFAVSSVISVILLALSGGYFVGGRIADRKSALAFFYYLILASGVAVVVIYILNLIFVPDISYSMSLRLGPLLISLLLFFLPSFLLGTLSPIVISLQNKRKKEGIGKTSGDVYAWSTLGSIVGSLGSGFFLIPYFGIDRIILGVGLLLIVIAILGLLGYKQNIQRTIVLLSVLLTFFLISQQLFSLSVAINKSRYVFTKDTGYGRIIVYNGTYYGNQVRFLKQDLDRSSASFLNSNDLVYDYTKYFKIYKLLNLQIKDALVIGAGAYSVPKALLDDDQSVRVDVVDIDPDLLGVVKKYFGVPQDSRLHSYIDDGRRYLHDTDKKYDLIFSDAFSFSTPFHLATKEFFQIGKDRLDSNGIFVMNIVGDLNPALPSFVLSEIRTFQGVFPNSYFFAAVSPDSASMQNIMLVGVNSGNGLDFMSAQKANDPFLRWIALNLIDIRKYDLARYNVFTDNYAPVEYYASKILNRF